MAAVCGVLLMTSGAFAAATCSAQQTFAVAVHGGAQSKHRDGTAQLAAITAALKGRI